MLALQVQKLKHGHPIEIPIYDFHTHSRKLETKKVEPKKLIIVDGILIFHPQSLRQLFDDLIFFDTPEDLRYMRRLERDTKERGRAPEGVRNQFLKQVKPMHDIFVEPSKHHAKSIVKDGDDFEKLISSFENLVLQG